MLKSFSLAETTIPAVGLGTYLIKNDAVAEVVQHAISFGYRHIDTAEAYKNEAGVGEGIRKGLDDNGLTRDDIFVTTKLWPGNPKWKQKIKTAEGTIAALDASLQRLGLDHVDLYLIHAPFHPGARLEQWSGLVTLQQQGKARAIGVSNFNLDHIGEIEAAGLPPPHANQIELHPWSQKTALVEGLTKRSILPIAYSSLVPLAQWRAAPGQKSAKTEAMRSAKDTAPFTTIAKKHAVAPAQVLLRWGLQMGFPVLPKSTQRDRLKANIALDGFALDADDMDVMGALDRGEGLAWGSGDPTKLT